MSETNLTFDDYHKGIWSLTNFLHTAVKLSTGRRKGELMLIHAELCKISHAVYATGKVPAGSDIAAISDKPLETSILKSAFRNAGVNVGILIQAKEEIIALRGGGEKAHQPSHSLEQVLTSADKIIAALNEPG